MPKYRVTLGRERSGSNLVTNGDFPANLTGWDPDGRSLGGGFIWFWSADFGGSAKLTGTQNILQQASIFTEGQFYEVTLDAASTDGNSTLGIAIGDYGGYSEIVPTTTLSSFAFKKQCIAGTQLRIQSATSGGGQSTNVDNVEAYLLDWRSPLTNEPKGLGDIEIALKRDRDIGAILDKFTSDLVFWGDGYDYIKEQIAIDVCSTIDVRVEKSCGDGTYKDLFVGAMYTNDIRIDEVKCEITAKIENIAASQVLINTKDTKVYLPVGSNSLYAVNMLPTAEDPVGIAFHDPTTGTHGASKLTYDVFLALRRIIFGATDVAVEVESEIFNEQPPNPYDPVFKHLQLGFMGNIASVVDFPDDDAESLSFKDLFTQLGNVFNLGVLVYTKPNGVPVVKIEKKNDLFGTTPVLTINNVKKLRRRFDKDNLVKNVNIGYDKVASNYGIDTNINFLGTQYTANNNCLDKTLELVSTYIQDTDIIGLVFTGTTSLEDKNDICLVETDGTQTKVFDRTSEGGGQYDYNGNIDPDDNMSRWTETLGITSLRLRESGEEISKTNANRINIYEFEAYLSDSDYELISDLTQPITFNSPADGLGDTDGFIFDLKRKDKTGLTKFKLLAE